MKNYVALLRGINVGGNNKIEMSKLKECFEKLGYHNVSTYINSGNVRFETEKTNVKELVPKIEKAIKKDFNLEIRVVLRDSNNIKKICKRVSDDWVNNSNYKTDVMFLWDEFADRSVLKLIKTNPKVDSLEYIDKAVVWHLNKKDYSKSKMKDIIGTEVYKNMTIRNINTVRKLNQLLSKE